MKKKSFLLALFMLIDLIIFIAFANDMNMITFLIAGYLIPVILLTFLIQMSIDKVSFKSVGLIILLSALLTMICNGIVSLGIVNVDEVMKNSQHLTKGNVSIDVSESKPTIVSFLSQTLSLSFLEVLIKYILQTRHK